MTVAVVRKYLDCPIFDDDPLDFRPVCLQNPFLLFILLALLLQTAT